MLVKQQFVNAKFEKKKQKEKEKIELQIPNAKLTLLQELMTYV